MYLIAKSQPYGVYVHVFIGTSYTLLDVNVWIFPLKGDRLIRREVMNLRANVLASVADIDVGGTENADESTVKSSSTKGT